MKKIFRFLVVALVGMLAITSCKEDDTVGFSLYGFNPNPATRGEAITFYGEGLDAIHTVRFVGGAEVTDITKEGSSISVIVPMTAQPGTIELCYNGGSYITKSAMMLNEPLASDAVLNGYTDYENKSNTTTMVGRKYYIETASDRDYLSDIVKVEFAGDEAVVEYDEAAFLAALGEEELTMEKLLELSEELDFVRSQYLVIVTIPQTAKSGAVYLYNSTDDRFTASDILLAQSMAESVEPATDIIAGQTELTITGENFDLVVSAAFTGGLTVESDALTIAADGKSLKLKTVLGMQDGPISLTTKSGDVIVTPEVKTIVPAVFSLWAENDLYKAGKQMTLSCNDTEDAETNFAILSQIESLNFVKADGSALACDFELNSEYSCMNITIPAEAADGKIEVTTYAGKTAVATESLVLVKAAVTECATEVNGGESFVVKGSDLDLISEVLLGDQKCEYEVNAEATELTVKTERTYTSGAVVVKQANGLELTAQSNLEVLAVGKVLVTAQPEAAVQGTEMTIEGTGFNHIESIEMGGAKVTSYTVRTDTQFSFIVPLDAQSGETYLTFHLFDGSVETSINPLMIAQTRLVEVTLWEGSVDLGNWSGNVTLPASTFAEATTETLFTIHYENQGGGQFKIMDGTWANLEMPDKSPYWEGIDAVEGSTSYSFTLSADQLALVQATGMVLAGQKMILTKLTHMVTEYVVIIETVTTIWEGSVDLAGWGGNVTLSAADFAGYTTSTRFTLYYENQGGGQFKVMDGNWTNLEMTDKSPYWEGVDAPDGSTSFEFTLSAENLAAVQATGMVLAGQNLILTKLTATDTKDGGSKVEEILPTDILLNDFESHGDHNSSWDSSWSDAAATEFPTEDGNTFIRTVAALTGWFVNCNHDSGGAFGAAIDDLSKYCVKFDLRIEEGVTGLSAVEMQVVLADQWFWYGAGFFPETTDGDWMTVTVDMGDVFTGAVDCTVNTNGLFSGGPIPAGVSVDNFRLSLK